MKLDLIDLLRADTAAQARCESYGLDPVKIEEWMLERAPSHADPTASEAVWRADRDLARRRRTR